jgi:hypothetical protein
VCFAEAIEIDEQIVPGFSLLVAMFERFESEE